ncbi:MAG: D-alanyl-D-alanine carboxypeptidase/D-alanyl-D-alanine-endopeptidase [Rubrivivax sp.]|nr:D-alanyl-D-alanine carboxypeptidase/D-alanyl-D-alanine-endopeptidase [Rubrivivax sp.]
MSLAARTRRCLAALLAWGLHGTASALPPEVERALDRARVPDSALVAVVQEAGSGRSVLSLRAQQPVNPASLAKLFTTAMALDQLGPAWSWSTPVWLQGPVRDGVLEGSLVIKGSGDPKLVMERLWLLLRRVQQQGVREIRGDIVLDNGAFAAGEGSPFDFDGDGLRPYNVRAEALLLNFKAVLYTFVPDPSRGVAQVLVEPPLAGTVVDRTVPLSAGPCDDWRGALKASLADPARVRFGGSYPAACGEQSWPLADAQPSTYSARLVAGLWREMGGQLTGQVREGPAPADRPSFEQRSPPLLDAVRDINKFSNNVMAQQLFLTLALQREPGRPATPATARDAQRRWVASRLGDPGAELVVDNGSGLSREGRASARLLARLLQQVHDGPFAAELASSLPISGVDGTLRRAKATPGRAHLKTGSLRDVAGVAGYVLSDSGRRYVVVAIVNHPQANAARPALDALVQWVMRDAPGSAQNR